MGFLCREFRFSGFLFGAVMSTSISFSLLPATPLFGADASEADQQRAQAPLRTFCDVAWDFAAQDIVTPRRLVRGVEAIVQWANFAMMLEVGAWFLDLRQGIPFRTRVWGVGRDLRAVREVFVRALLIVPGITTVDNLDLNHNAETRRIRPGKFRGRIVTGDYLEIPDFIVPE